MLFSLFLHKPNRTIWPATSTSFVNDQFSNNSEQLPALHPNKLPQRHCPEYLAPQTHKWLHNFHYNRPHTSLGTKAIVFGIQNTFVSICFWHTKICFCLCFNLGSNYCFQYNCLRHKNECFIRVLLERLLLLLSRFYLQKCMRLDAYVGPD